MLQGCERAARPPPGSLGARSWAKGEDSRQNLGIRGTKGCSPCPSPSPCALRHAMGKRAGLAGRSFPAPPLRAPLAPNATLQHRPPPSLWASVTSLALKHAPPPPWLAPPNEQEPQTQPPGPSGAPSPYLGAPKVLQRLPSGAQGSLLPLGPAGGSALPPL